MKKNLALYAFAALSLVMLGDALPAYADDATAQISIKNKAFDPAELTVPANQKVKITVTNNDGEAAEFESLELNREKIVPAHDSVTVYVGPLDPGTYPFFNDFDPNKAKGKIIAK
jgi:plastocyanin